MRRADFPCHAWVGGAHRRSTLVCLNSGRILATLRYDDGLWIARAFPRLGRLLRFAEWDALAPLVALTLTRHGISVVAASTSYDIACRQAEELAGAFED